MRKILRNSFTKRSLGHLHRYLLCATALIFSLTIAPLANPAVSSTTAEDSSAGQSRYATLDGARLHYVNYGKGSEALILIHGWTMNEDNWRDQVADFAKRNRVIAVDLPGHGKSDKPQVSYSIDFFARAVEAVMRDAKVRRAVLVGHSMGTPIARQFYRKYPDKTLGIVIADGPLLPFGEKAMMDSLTASFRGPNHKDATGQFFAGMFGPSLSAGSKERIQASRLSTPQYVLVSAWEGMGDASIWGEDEINVPVLAIMANNPFFGPDLEQRYRSIAPNIDFRLWDGVGHFVMMERAKEFNEAVLAFLDKNKLLTRK
jgi:pimeloyl-ACP methyl ester carboxylesterase